MKSKLIKTAVAFLLLVPFRLSISVLLIKIFTWTATVSDKTLPTNVIKASVITSKICYDLAVVIYLCVILYSVYTRLATYTKEEYGSEKEAVHDWRGFAVAFTIIATAVFIGTDVYLTNIVFYHFNQQL